MTIWQEHGPVVLGVPDTGADPLIPIAVARARDLGAAIDVVRVWREVEWMLSASAADMRELARDEKRDRALLEAAARQVRELAPDIAVVVDFAPGDLYTELLERTRGASVLIIGDDLTQDASVAAWYLEHSFCPVAVVDAAGNLTAEGPGTKRLSRYGPHRG